MKAPTPPVARAWAQNLVALYAALIEDRVPFAQAVYGDGEWKSILGTGVGKNDQGETFCPELGDMLRETLLHPAGQWCVLWPGKAGRRTYRQAHSWITDHQPDVRWLPFRPLSWAAVMGLAAPFFEACRTRPVVLVGPAHLTELPDDVLQVEAHIITPRQDSWRAVDGICQAVVDTVHAEDLVLFASGQGATVMIHRLARELDEGVSFGGTALLDVGSMLDPFTGVLSRRVHRAPGWAENVLPRNVPGT